MSKKLKEMSTSAAVTGYPGSFMSKKKKLPEATVSNVIKPADAAVYPGMENPHFDPKAGPSEPESRRLKRPITPKRKLTYRIAKMEETQSETKLRETIRDILFLNKIKFYEEQAKVALEENKLRYIIRTLLREAKEVNYSTTGQNFGANALDNTKLALKKYEELSTSLQQRESFRKNYIAAITSALETLDKQHELFSTPLQPAASMPAVGAPAAKRKDMDEAEGEAPEAPLPQSVSSEEEEALKKQAIEKTVKQTISTLDQTASKADDRTGYEAAKAAAERDVPQIASLYMQLSNEKKAVTEPDGTSRETTDKEDFKKMLLGNLELKFDSINKLSPTSDKGATTPAPVEPAEPAAAAPAEPAAEEQPAEA